MPIFFKNHKEMPRFMDIAKLQGRDVVYFIDKLRQGDITLPELDPSRPKYKIDYDGPSKVVEGQELHRVVALQDFSWGTYIIHAGDKGGWVANERNLSQEGPCWITDDACAIGESRIEESALVGNKALLKEKAMASGDAIVGDKAVLKGESCAHGKAVIQDRAELSGISRAAGECQVGNKVKMTERSFAYGTAVLAGDMTVFGDQTFSKGEITEAPAKKFELDLSDSKVVEGRPVYRIVACDGFDWSGTDIKPGDKGGYVESAANLSQQGRCWIYDDAVAMGKSIVKDDAQMRESALAMDEVVIDDDAVAKGHCLLKDKGELSGHAVAEDFVIIREEAKVASAKMCDHAEAYGHAIVAECVTMSGHSKAYGNTVMGGYGIELKDFAQAYGKSRLKGRVELYGDAQAHGSVELNGDFSVGIGASLSERGFYVEEEGFYPFDGFFKNPDHKIEKEEFQPNLDQVLAFDRREKAVAITDQYEDAVRIKMNPSKAANVLEPQTLATDVKDVPQMDAAYTAALEEQAQAILDAIPQTPTAAAEPAFDLSLKSFSAYQTELAPTTGLVIDTVPVHQAQWKLSADNKPVCEILMPGETMNPHDMTDKGHIVLRIPAEQVMQAEINGQEKFIYGFTTEQKELGACVYSRHPEESVPSAVLPYLHQPKERVPDNILAATRDLDTIDAVPTGIAKMFEPKSSDLNTPDKDVDFKSLDVDMKAR